MAGPAAWRLLIADDYDRLGGRFPGVTRAVDAFCAEVGARGPWSLRGKCKFTKPNEANQVLRLCAGDEDLVGTLTISGVQLMTGG